MKTKKYYYCSHCKQQIISDDAGYGHTFKKGQNIFCKKRALPRGSLHYCDENEMQTAILDTASGEQEWDRKIYSYGVEAIVEYRLPIKR